ncbi:acyltransferase family protein [Flavobacterium silvaticum]|uniref:Acyltransferase n=1 Tax=Flavobacterium silvaticum TaxID=1852020 RepID=A0A972JHR2_9FLAO|nr:acyltransferase [Flavobacterium silvaticum]NMH29501.1 acyltransferase [Flavobacterium silvaticum]
MIFSLRRITSSRNFIPEIDGLRFLAISSVVFYHLWHFFLEKDFHSYQGKKNYPILDTLLSHGDFGVPFFFVISACVLGILFAGNTSGFSIKKYFFRRITRIEPPYFISITLLFFGIIHVAKIATFEEQLPKYLSSLAYISNFVYPRAHVNGVAWSLEIEVQFYLIAPILALVFRIKNVLSRRFLLAVSALVFLLLRYFISPGFVSIFDYFHFFLIGFLIADWYVCGIKFLPSTKADSILALLFFGIIWIFKKQDFQIFGVQFLWEAVQLICLTLFFYYVLIQKSLSILTKSWITNIGGMCYSIYLLHFYLISAFGNLVLQVEFSGVKLLNLGMYSLLIMIPMSAICLLFYVLIERPCMDPQWPKKILKLFRKKKCEEGTEGAT